VADVEGHFRYWRHFSFFLAKPKVDEFVSRLTAVAEPVSRKGPNHVSIAEAALRGNCSQVAVVELVLERKLKWVGRLGRKTAYNSILVDLAEIHWWCTGWIRSGFRSWNSRRSPGSSRRWCEPW
jgi:hypothetical protein